MSEVTLYIHAGHKPKFQFTTPSTSGFLPGKNKLLIQTTNPHDLLHQTTNPHNLQHQTMSSHNLLHQTRKAQNLLHQTTNPHNLLLQTTTSQPTAPKPEALTTCCTKRERLKTFCSSIWMRWCIQCALHAHSTTRCYNYTGTSPIRNSAPLGPYSRNMPRDPWRP